MLKKILTIGLVLAIIGGGYGYYLYNKPVASTASKSADFILSANDLAAQYDDAKHLGKVIEVSGKVANIEKSAPDAKNTEGVTTVSIETADPITAVSCEMEKGSSTDLTVGSEVKLRGQCDGKLSDVVLTRCIIVAK